MEEKLENHLKSLKSRVLSLDTLISEEASRPEPDSLKIQEYKKQRLKLQEDISLVEKSVL